MVWIFVLFGIPPGTPAYDQSISLSAGMTSTVVTVIVRPALLEPEAFPAIRVTEYEPSVVNVWLGFCAVLVAPSPKFHCHEVGVPVDVSVNATARPGAGKAGL